MSNAPRNRIATWRLKKGWTQTQLADAAGTTAAQVGKLENGERKLSTDWMERLATALGCLPADLLPERFTRPYLSKSEERWLAMYRSMNDDEQLRWQRALRAWSDDHAPHDLALIS